MLISAILKCIPVMPPLLTWLANLGQIFAGLGGPVCMSAPPLLSSHWFPPHQRATATAIMANSGWMGLAVSFLLGPRLVSEHNMTGLNISVQRLYAAQERNDIRFFMYLEGGWTALLFLAVLVYFPNSPPKPPSKSAAVERLDFKDGLRQLVRHRRLWLVGLSFSIALGVFNAWNTMLDVNLNGLLGISQTEAGSLACYAVIGGAVFGFFLAVFADVFSGHLRLMLLVLFTLGVGFITWFCILCDGFIPFSSVSLYLSCIVGGTFVSASVPLFYELACETTYPIAEGITGGFISWLLNICGIPFLIVTMIPNLSQFWMNWAFLAAIILPIPLLLLFKEKYTRLTLDDSEDTDTDIQKASVPVIT
ncbi:disrupted in renal carcinoma protein 2 homolog isoform X2 [Lingula anatina]|nr:disrupted in renal carcinoma protein 2 homolog isoform X2 [Lingula anatina]|eukprot:XP_013389217.1 disrupted in renal carcinoma protein 2 homolog isoform X2 [Lingula anatina]